MDFGALFGWLGQTLLEVVLPSLATVIAGLVIGLLSRYLKKVKIELTAEQEARLRAIVEDAVKATEEVARRQATAGTVMSSRDKDSMTATAVLNAMPDLPAGQLRTAIDAALPEVRKRLEPSTPATFGRRPAS